MLFKPSRTPMTSATTPPDIAATLGSIAAVPDEELARLTTWLYPELHRLAQRAMRGERANHTLQTTSLVHEAYLKLADSDLRIASRSHFLALCARIMRRILIDHARGHERVKRGGPKQQITLDEGVSVTQGPDLDVLALDQALERLQKLDGRRAQLLECQLFAGMSYPEMAEAVSISEATVHRELRLARAWLQREMAGSTEPPAAN
ncbi:MAG: ECF-type sigma factor [Lysobacterales bacterium]